MNSADDVLKSLLSLMEKEIQNITIDIWFSDATAVDLRQDCFIIRTTTPYTKELILTRYGDLVRKTLGQIFSADMDFIVLDADEPVPGDAAAPAAKSSLPPVPEHFKALWRHVIAVREALRRGDDMQVLSIWRDAVAHKPQEHAIIEGTQRFMSQIGG